MRAREFITEGSRKLLKEGMSFEPAIKKTEKDDSGKTHEYWTGEPWWEKSEEPCPGCQGTGQDEYQGKVYKCSHCDGRGMWDRTRSTAPTLSVSNSNGMAIQDMLGLDPDYSGVIEHQDLPYFIKRLIRLKNQGAEEYTQKPTDTKGGLRRTGQSGNVTTVGAGPRMIDMGRSSQQVEHYIDSLLELFKFAQQNGAAVSWG